jgi:hypothetical protein
MFPKSPWGQHWPLPNPVSETQGRCHFFVHLGMGPDVEDSICLTSQRRTGLGPSLLGL